MSMAIHSEHPFGLCPTFTCEWLHHGLNKEQTLPAFPLPRPRLLPLSLSFPFVSITPSKPLPRGIALAWYGLSGQELRFYNTHSPQKTTLALLPWQGQEETKDRSQPSVFILQPGCQQPAAP